MEAASIAVQGTVSTQPCYKFQSGSTAPAICFSLHPSVKQFSLEAEFLPVVTSVTLLNRARTAMTSNVNIWSIFSIVVTSVLMEAAAAARDLTALSPVPSVDLTKTVTNEDILLEWLKITAVPLAVFLLGACTWGCIEHSVVWRSLTRGRGEFNEAPVEGTIDSNRDASDVEVVLELPHRRMEGGLAAMSAQALEVQHPLGLPDAEEKSVASDAAQQLQRC